jgi:four helix bundle protein
MLSQPFEEMSSPWEEQFWRYELPEHSFLHECPRNEKRPFDLSERTARFGEEIIKFAIKIPRNPVNDRLINQLVGAGTSVGANYAEADDSVSKKDFKNRIGTCRKESKETKYWLRMIAIAQLAMKAEARLLWQEAKELNLIFGAIWRKP